MCDNLRPTGCEAAVLTTSVSASLKMMVRFIWTRAALHEDISQEIDSTLVHGLIKSTLHWRNEQRSRRVAGKMTNCPALLQPQGVTGA